MTKSNLHKVDHKILRYTNCWEDADLLLDGLKLNTGARVLSIGSAGDNSFSILTANPERVLCVDINATQLALIQLKKAAFRALEHKEFLEFLGFISGDPLRNWKRVKSALDEETQDFWQARIELLQQGIIYTGKFERYLLAFQRKLLSLMHGHGAVEELFRVKPEEQQQSFYQNTWNNWRWKVFTRLFFSRKALSMGRDPEFLRQVEGNVGSRVKKRINQHLASTDAQQNYFLRFMLQGSFNGTLPHYTRAENFQKIKNNLDKLEVFHGSLQDCSEGGFTHANLSNIFEYLDKETFAENAHLLAKRLEPGAKLAYWNLFVERDLADSFPAKFSSPDHRPFRQDYGFFYKSFKLNHKSEC